MSRPPLNPDKTAAGIIVDPRTLERVIPESRRPDGTVRKQLKVRPGFTPQEDVQRFRGTRQQQMDKTTLPKGHIIGWVAPSSAAQSKPMSKSAKKNAKRKEKRDEKKPEPTSPEPVPDNWEDDDDDIPSVATPSETSAAAKKEPSSEHTADKPNESGDCGDVESLTTKVEKLNV